MKDYPTFTNTPDHAFCGRVPTELRLDPPSRQWVEAPGEPSILSVFAAAGGFLIITLVILFLFEGLG